MAADPQETEAASTRDEMLRRRASSHGHDSTTSATQATDDDDDDDGDEEEEDADEEPKLKYTRLTSNLGSVYRNGDATSSFMVAGDKMVWRCLLAGASIVHREC
jgi:hypothetical protein